MSLQTTLEILGEEELTKRIWEGTLEGEFYDKNITSFKAYYPYPLWFPLLTNICLPNLTTLSGTSALLSNTKIKHFNYSESFPSLPQSQYQNSSSMLSNCYELESVIVPSNMVIGSNFCYCAKNLQSVNFENISSLNDSSFSYCRSLNSVVVSDGAYQNVSNSSSSFPFYETFLDSYTYLGEEINVSSSTYPKEYGCVDFGMARAIFFPNLKSLGTTNLFIWAIDLSRPHDIIIGSIDDTSPVLMSNIYTTSSGESKDGIWRTTYSRLKTPNLPIYLDLIPVKFYVADSLVDEYKEATNWSLVADYIFPISEYEPFWLNSEVYIQDSWEQIMESIEDESYLTKYRIGQLQRTFIKGIGMITFIYDGTQKDICVNEEESSHMSFSVYSCPNTYNGIASGLAWTGQYHNEMSFSDSTRDYSGNVQNLSLALEAVFELLPIELKENIQTVKKQYVRYNSQTNTGSSLIEEERKLYLHSLLDCGISNNSYKGYTSGSVFDFYDPQSFSWEELMRHRRREYSGGIGALIFGDTSNYGTFLYPYTFPNNSIAPNQAYVNNVEYNTSYGAVTHPLYFCFSI